DLHKRPGRVFFPAEDGIRDGHVTGVQTCALPICELVEAPSSRVLVNGMLPFTDTPPIPGLLLFVPLPRVPGKKVRNDCQSGIPQIGRASCRERVEVAAAAGPGEETRVRRRLDRSQ